MKKAGYRAEMIYTGQTGWMQGAKYGFVFDSTPQRFYFGRDGACRSAMLGKKQSLILFLLKANLRYVIQVARLVLSGLFRPMLL
jgi:hypothetical protein